MKPKIGGTQFGSITIEGVVSEHDVMIGLNGAVKKRKKKLSKAVYGTSHIISLDEAKFVYEKGAEGVMVEMPIRSDLEISRLCCQMPSSWWTYTLTSWPCFLSMAAMMGRPSRGMTNFSKPLYDAGFASMSEIFIMLPF